MSGVSISEGGNIDLDAIIQGGDAFLERIKAIKVAKDEFNQAFENLNLGKSAAAALADAQTTVANAVTSADEIKAEAEKLLADARNEAASIVPAAQTEADQIIAQAKAEAARLNAEVDVGRQALVEWSNKTKEEANGIMQQATATKSAADKQLADNQVAAATLAEAQAQAQAAIDKANVLQATLTAKIDAVNRAAAS